MKKCENSARRKKKEGEEEEEAAARVSEGERAAEEEVDVADKRKLEKEEKPERNGCQTTRSRKAHEALNRRHREADFSLLERVR